MSVWAIFRDFRVGRGFLENRQSGGGQGTGVDVLGVRSSVQGRFGGTAVDLRQSVLEKLDGGQDLQKAVGG